MNYYNIKRCKFPQKECWTLEKLQKIVDSFGADSKPTAQGLINYLKYEEQTNQPQTA